MTPGPWTFRDGDASPYYRSICDAAGRVVVGASGYDGELTIDDADAHAIAAAPDLVYACRTALVTFERYADHHEAKGADGKAAANRALAETMRQALRKAGVEP